MQQRGSTRRHGETARTAGVSAWEGGMKIEKVRGGVKAIDGKEGCGRGGARNGCCSQQRLSRNRSDGGAWDKRKSNQRKTSESDKSPVQRRKTLSEPAKVVRDSDENCRESGEIGGDGGGGGGEEDVAVDLEEEGEFDDKDDLGGGEVEQEVLEEEQDKMIDQIHVAPTASIAEASPSDKEYCPEIDPMDPCCEAYEQTMSGNQEKMQNIVDLVMWREVSRSALVFGIGTFMLVSSAYTKDLNFSLISAISYMGLIYLAAIFFHKSILHRGMLDPDPNQKSLVGEAEATWLIRKLLPYINELLSKTRIMFSGDPATTMKTAMALFVLARCGGSVTVWSMAKLAFFGAFTVPKIWSSYSAHIHRYGTFFLERSRDAWDSCTHKKVTAVAAFTVLWNLSSAAARAWAVFMLVVTVRYYQQQRPPTAAKWVDGDEVGIDVEQRQGVAAAGEGPSVAEASEEKGQEQKQRRRQMVASAARRRRKSSDEA